MMPIVAQLLVAVGMLAMQDGAALPAQRPIPVATIRILVTNNDDHLSARVLRNGQEAAARIYRTAGIRIEWVDRIASELPMVVAIPPPGGAERLRIGVNAMGYTFRTEDPGPGGRALVFFDRVERQALASRTDTVQLLGAVIAHEIGHMLLRNAHVPNGLMRGLWTDHEFTLISMGFLRFSAVEQTRIQSQLSDIRLTAAHLPD
jgi:hypothetical protein